MRPLGFEEQASVYVRHSNGAQVQAIELGAAKYENAFHVDIGVHFSDVPPFPRGYGATGPEYGPDACCFRMRLREADQDQFFGYGETIGAAESLARELARGMIATFDSFQAGWGDGSPIAKALPPDQLGRDAELFGRALLTGQHALFNDMRVRQLFPGWHPHVLPVGVLLAFLSLKRSDQVRAAEYLRVAQHSSQKGLLNASWRALLARAGRACRRMRTRSPKVPVRRV
jgi:hypothetical protein